MKLLFRFIVFTLIAITICSCAKHDCLRSAGKQTTEVRILTAFNKIEIYNYFNIYLKQDTISQVMIEAGEKELTNITTEVTNNALVIKDLNACQFMKGYAEKNIYISIGKINELIVQDGVNLYSTDTLKQDELLVRFVSDIGHCDLSIDCSCLRFEAWYPSGDFVFRGKTGFLYILNEQLSFVHAEGLDALNCYVYNNSMGSCYVKTNGVLEVYIKNSGDVHYSGQPSEILLKEKTGNGQLIKDE